VIKGHTVTVFLPPGKVPVAICSSTGKEAVVNSDFYTIFRERGYDLHGYVEEFKGI